ncbi:hypothetical protein H9P43_002184 [Blastocladiella emersonii ATCC 22665]|nr:hypothetical protein H9P43_002184 [Blastocladiella emersonii ATCC 22665]
MSDYNPYRASNAKHWCKYCKTFITDNKISRDHHETKSSHKRNMERFINEIAVAETKRKQEEEETKRMVAQIEESAYRAYVKDLMAMGMDAEAAELKATAELKKGKPAPAKPPKATAAPRASAPAPEPAADEFDPDPETTPAAEPGAWTVVEEVILPANDAEDEVDEDVKPPRPSDEQAPPAQQEESELKRKRFVVEERVTTLDTDPINVVNTVLGGAARADDGSAPVLKKRKGGNRPIRKK